MGKFKIKSAYKPTPDQKKAINKLSLAIKERVDYQVLLGVTGSGKTFTVANVIEKLQRPTLIFLTTKLWLLNFTKNLEISFLIMP